MHERRRSPTTATCAETISAWSAAVSCFASSSRSPRSARPASSSRSMRVPSVSVVTPGCSSATNFTRHTSFSTSPPSFREPETYLDREPAPHGFACSHYRATFRSLFGGVPVRVRRLLVCSCHGPGEPKSFAALDLGKDAVAPELAYVTAKFAALAPFGKVAALLSELLPISGAQSAGTVRNRTLRVGQEVVPQRPIDTARPPTAPADGPVVIGLDGGCVRSRRRPERHFEVVM